MRRTRIVVPVLLVVLVAVSACTRSGSTPSAKRSAAASAALSLQQFAACMREHGQNVPDPDVNSGNVSITQPAGTNRGAWDAAMRSCQHFLPGGGQPVAPDPQQLESLRQYAMCMRAHGIEVTDPDPATGKSQIQGRLANASRDQIINDPGYKAADAACRNRLPSAAPPKTDNK